MDAVFKPHMVIGIDLGMTCKCFEDRRGGKRDVRPAMDFALVAALGLDLGTCSLILCPGVSISHHFRAY